MIAWALLLLCSFDGPPRRTVPKLAIVIPEKVEVMRSGWRRMPWRATRTFHWGYFTYCDDPDCWMCAEVVYGYDPEYDDRPVVEIKK